MATRRRPSTGERLLARLRAELAAHGVELPASARCVRQWPRESDRVNGAWLWFVHSDTEPVPDIGSIWPMYAVVRAPVWHLAETTPTYSSSRSEWHVDLA